MVRNNENEQSESVARPPVRECDRVDALCMSFMKRLAQTVRSHVLVVCGE